MRIGILNWSARLAGGVEHYLATLLPGLRAAGHEVAFLSEVAAPSDREPIPLPGGTPAWCVEELGVARAFEGLRAWKPSVLYAHAIREPALEGRLLDVAPSVWFAHQYHGTCVSGTKTFSFPAARPCAREFGLACLVHFYPRRCGGLDPATMVADYRRQAKRLELLRRYRMIVTHSEHMRTEYLKHGVTQDRVRRIPFLLRPPSAPRGHVRAAGKLAEILFVGRMERLKGGAVLLRALPSVCAALSRPVRVTLVGEGRERGDWERVAARVQEETSGLEICFAGWAAPEEVDRHYSATDLLVMPSLWPEPFGLSGPEAGRYGVPAAAFAVGGIGEWLKDGVNGCVAPGDPPTVEGLARAVVRCLADTAFHEKLQAGARAEAARHTPERHIPALLEILEQARR